MSQIVRIRTKQTLMRPEVAQFIMRAARESGFPSGGAVLAEMALEVEAEWLGIFVGLVDDAPRFAAVGQLPTSAFHLAGTVHLAYSDKAPRQLAACVAKRLREWFTRSGVGYVLVANLQHTDRSYIRGLSYFGRGSRVGGVIRFDF